MCDDDQNGDCTFLRNCLQALLESINYKNRHLNNLSQPKIGHTFPQNHHKAQGKSSLKPPFSENLCNGKGGHTCFLPFDKFFDNYLAFFPGFCPLCILFLKYSKPQGWQLPLILKYESARGYSTLHSKHPQSSLTCLPGTAGPEAGVVADLWPAHVLHRDVRHYLRHRAEGLVARLPRLGLVGLHPHTGHLLLHS